MFTPVTVPLAAPLPAGVVAPATGGVVTGGAPGVVPGATAPLPLVEVPPPGIAADVVVPDAIGGSLASGGEALPVGLWSADVEGDPGAGLVVPPGAVPVATLVPEATGGIDDVAGGPAVTVTVLAAGPVTVTTGPGTGTYTGAVTVCVTVTGGCVTVTPG